MTSKRPFVATRREAVRWLGLAAAASLLAACGGAEARPPAQPPTPASTGGSSAASSSTGAAVVVSSPVADKSAASQPKSGGKLRSAQSVDLDANGVEGARGGPAFLPAIYQIFDTLTAYDENRRPKPMLAESWDFSADQKELKLNLRKGVTFHSGRDFTSDDVKYNLLRVRDPKIAGGQFAGMSNWFSSIETPDKNTVVLKAEQARPLVWDFFEYHNIIDKDIAEGPNAKTSAGGTGPFQFVEWVTGDHLSFVKNKNYWQSGRPYLDEISISIVKDANTMAVQLESGSLDALINPPIVDAARLQKDPEYQVAIDEVNGISYSMWINSKVAPFDNKLVRQGLSYALDRKRFCDTTLRTLSSGPSTLPWPPGSPAYDKAKNESIAFDLDKAKALFQQAGASSVEMVLNYSSIATELATMAQIVQSDLAKIGIKLTLNPLEAAVATAAVSAHNFAIALSNNSFSQLDPGSMFQLSGGYRPTDNVGQFSNETYDMLFKSLQSETDPAKRKQLYTQLNDFLLDENPNYAIAAQPWFMVARNNVHDIKWRVNQAPIYSEMWIG